LTGKLLLAYKQKIADLKLIPAGGGAFELTVNGELIYSKLATDQFPDEDAMVDAVGSRLKKR
jgi:selenoprotein W-related protein